MAKRSQHDSGEERVTAKSRPMMNLIARAPSHVSSSTSVSPGKKSYGSQDPWSSIAKKEERSGWPDIGIDRLKASDHCYHEQFMESFSSSSYAKWDDDRAWSSQEWKTDIETYERSGQPDENSWRMIRKVRPGFSHEEILLDGTAHSVRSEEILRDRSGRPDIDSQEKAWPQQFVIGNDEAELELSVESRSFVNRVNDQVQKKTKEFPMLQKMEKPFYDLVNVYGCNNGISSIHEKELPEQLSLHCEHDRSHTQTNVRHIDEIGVWARWDLRIGNNWLAKVWKYVFSDSMLCLGKILENCEFNDAWGQRLGWIKSSQNYRNFDRIDGEPMEFEWKIFLRIQNVAAQWGSRKFTVQIGRNTRKFHRKNSIYVDVQRHFLWNKRQWRRMSGKCSTRIFVCKKIWKRTMVIHWSWFWEKVVLYQRGQSTRNLGQNCRKECCWNSRQLKSKVHGKLSIHLAADQETIETIFRIIVSANQLSLHGAVAEICEEYESLHERTERPVVMGQSSSSIVLSAIKTEVPLNSDDPAF